MFVRSWSNSDRGTPGCAAIGRGCYLHVGETPGVVVVLYIEGPGVFTSAVVRTDNRDIAEALARVGKTTVETAAGIGGKIHAIDDHGLAPGGTAIGGFGDVVGGLCPTAVAGRAISDTTLPGDVHIASFVSGNVAELVNGRICLVSRHPDRCPGGTTIGGMAHRNL